MQDTEIEVLTDLSVADRGSWYTIRVTGGDLQEWVGGVSDRMAQAGIERPTRWYQTTGQAVNEYAEPSNWRNAFPADLTLLMFPLDGIDVGKLAIFRLKMQDVWFDDMIANMR